MLNADKAVKVSIYLSEGATYHGTSTSSRILDFLFYRGVAGATMIRGVAGFGADHQMRSANLVEISDRLPLKIEFIETAEKVNELLGKLQKMANNAVIEVQETTILKALAVDKRGNVRPAPHSKVEGHAKLMRIYISEADQWHQKPLHLALVEAMRANDIAGATVYKGILGYGAHGHLHKENPLSLSRQGSIMLSAIDTEDRIRAFLPIVEQMVEEGLVVLSDVDVIKYAYRPVAGEE